LGSARAEALSYSAV